MNTLTIRNLLMESRVSENLSSQVNRLKELSNNLKSLSENVKTIKSLNESSSNSTLANDSLKECARLFKEAKKNLSEAKESSNIVEVHNSLRIAYNCMNDIDDLRFEIEESLHGILDIIEESEKNLIESVEYEDVFFVQGHEADEILELINTKGERAALEYMKQWHYPGEHMTRPEPGHGSDDEIFQRDGYILSYNPRIGYAGLVYRLEEE